ncbi:UNVERIFIED_CONTAM: Zinc finger CCCH domain-containing protein 55 [Sesamum latifolium]|uniref:Zinc finger CCCH domain-containing protein 55 n=1 Tax=Sesamum latifolium TaxID=2727402 RepID=A0AAW2UFM8_9LAMI
MTNFGSSSSHLSNLTSRQGGPHIIGEDRLTGHPVQGMNPSQSVAHGQTNSLLMQSPSKGMHSSLGGNLPSESNSSHSRSYFQQAPYGRQYFAAGGISAEFAEAAKVSSSVARTTPDFPERNQPSYMHDFVGSRIVNHFNPYASTFDLPLSSKFSSNALTQDNDATIGTKYGAPFGLGSVSIDGHKTGSVGSKNMISSSSSGLPAESVLPRLGGNQYDPLFDSIEPASNSFSRADFLKHEAVGDSDNMPRFSGSGRVLKSGRVLNMEGIEQHEGGTAASTNDSLEIEECGETADAEIGAVLNGSSSNPNDTTDLNAGEIEIDQVKASGKKKKGKDSRSMKLFKISIATFVKEVLKPSWRQGNMSKEAFKTIVKKTVDKVSGAMKSHHIPRSQSKINHYIDSSRGKLTKLVMLFCLEHACIKGSTLLGILFIMAYIMTSFPLTLYRASSNGNLMASDRPADQSAFVNKLNISNNAQVFSVLGYTFSVSLSFYGDMFCHIKQSDPMCIQDSDDGCRSGVGLLKDSVY